MQRQRQKMAIQKMLTRTAVRNMYISTICTTLAWLTGPSPSISYKVFSWSKCSRASSSNCSIYISSKISSFIYFQSSFQDLTTSPLSYYLCFSVYTPMITMESERLFTAEDSSPAQLVADTINSIFSSSFLQAIGTQIDGPSLPFTLATQLSLCLSLIAMLLSLQSFKSAYPPGQFESVLQQDRQLISFILKQILTSKKVPNSLQTKQSDLVGILVNAENSSCVYCLCGTLLTLSVLYSQITLMKQQTCNSSFLVLVLEEKWQGMASRMSYEQLFPCFSH